MDDLEDQVTATLAMRDLPTTGRPITTAVPPGTTTTIGTIVTIPNTMPRFPKCYLPGLHGSSMRRNLLESLGQMRVPRTILKAASPHTTILETPRAVTSQRMLGTPKAVTNLPTTVTPTPKAAADPMYRETRDRNTTMEAKVTPDLATPTVRDERTGQAIILPKQMRNNEAPNRKPRNRSHLRSPSTTWSRT
ncbi:hypothetical protein LTR28_001413 [Elasticomyces elasticus]|nr:hypothetical protein LTR28_001413 [Elasticomyces elasticus]